MKLRLLLLTALLCTLTVTAAQKVKVACIGNSITYGYKLPDPATDSYPSQLQRLLGDDYQIGNFGYSGATLLRHGHRPYNKLDEFRKALEFTPDIAVIHLGVNDTDPRDWANYGSEFVGDYLAIIDSLRAVNPKVRVIVALLTPLRADHYRFPTGTRCWRLKIQDAIRNVAAISGAELIDFDTPLRDRQNLIFDAIHPNVEGAGILAETVRGAITGQYGGLWLPAVIQSGMVLQRNTPLTFSGRADAGARIALTLDNRTYHAVTDNRGDWSITTGPVVTGPEYTLTVTDGSRTLSFDHILAGEVWLASGQSNMEYNLGEQPDRDPLLRVYDMKPVARTNNVQWSDSIVSLMNRLQHYRPTSWSEATPEFSAVAYHFGRMLRDSLQVPVGIICNAVGGSPAESWIDISTLEREMPGILLNPRGNDYLQKWVQQRMGENLGDRKDGRHPYEPGYLFGAAIRPLKVPALGGVIWYQGESNAHNMEIHEQLLPMLVADWRRELRKADLPFLFVQLSSLNRPSWPEFRDSQRRLAQAIPGTGMAVSSDCGDSLDVHPRNKRPVGRRLGRLALHRVYGHNIEDQGPTPDSVITSPGAMTVTFSHARGLRTSDGAAPRTFEIAEYDGLYYPAEAVIEGNKIILKNMNVKNPRFVRYGWQPFTRANVVNSDGLPASTFKSEADNAASLNVEPGYDRGVSAFFCGMCDGRLIMAGGANFPCDDPLAADARKVTYSGIYAADPADLQWRRTGSLPEPMAYGTSATTPRGLVWTCGRRAMLFDGDTLTDLPALPAAIDNAASAAIGPVVYVAGGNCNGEPSHRLYALNINNQAKGWTRLADMPGNARVQPVMAASGGKLCLWGGFCGKKPATLNTDGLCYDPAKNKWSRLPAPDGDISLGGGMAATLPDGNIAVAGGVNKNIFLEALRNQAPDYLQHPAEWYRFNTRVMVYQPSTGRWHTIADTPEAARAGCGVVAAPGNLYIIGGELKPRIRTNTTLGVSIP